MLLLPPALLVLLLPLLVPQPPLQLPRPLPLRPQPVLLPLPLKLAKMPLVLPKTLPVPPLQPLLALLVMLPRRPLTPPPALSRSKLTQIEVTHLSRKSHLRVAFFLPENVQARMGPRASAVALYTVPVAAQKLVCHWNVGLGAAQRLRQRRARQFRPVVLPAQVRRYNVIEPGVVKRRGNAGRLRVR